mmetsp:Transcript_87993/g.138944  ORF Transcript_87993/g.138944 Transcript_87993/m.138944 type:complete len:396 (+) Transcript_87993:83-1270(+)
MAKEGRWLGLYGPTPGVVKEPATAENVKLFAFGNCTIEVSPPKAENLEVQLGPTLARLAGPISPWVDAKVGEDGVLQLPLYDSELPNANPSKWVPGEFTAGVDNIEKNAEGNSVKEWGGMKVSPGPAGFDSRADLLVDPTVYPPHIERLMKVPHMPGQPAKEMWARLKAFEPRLFEDSEFSSVHRNLPEDWRRFVGYTKWAESFGINTESVPAEWAGQELACAPAVYCTPRAEVFSICVGISATPGERVVLPEAPGAEYDFLEYLYAKDQEGKVIQIQDYKSHGIEKISFVEYSFVPPEGTLSITPYACFKIRGVWMGEKLKVESPIENPDMQWFTDMPWEERKKLADASKLQASPEQEAQATSKRKTRKTLPKLWPENSWEGNCAKARNWDLMH